MRRYKLCFENKTEADEYVVNASGYPCVVYMRADSPYFDKAENKWAVFVTEYERD
jgi:hypothetical protein